MSSKKVNKPYFSSFRRKSLDVLGTLSAPKGPESSNTKNFWTPATLSRRKPGAGVTALRFFCETIDLDLHSCPRRLNEHAFRQPRPIKGMFVAMIVKNWTLVSSGRLAM
jgi:hypothetical protein